MALKVPIKSKLDLQKCHSRKYMAYLIRFYWIWCVIFMTDCFWKCPRFLNPWKSDFRNKHNHWCRSNLTVEPNLNLELFRIRLKSGAIYQIDFFDGPTLSEFIPFGSLRVWNIQNESKIALSLSSLSILADSYRTNSSLF